MPNKIKKSKPVKKLAQEEVLVDVIRHNLEVINEDPFNYEETKKVICPFYKGGNNVACIGCKQAESILQECVEDYKDKILSRPMKVWGPEFDLIEIRDKVSIETVSVGLACDRCYLSEVCPLFKKRSLCAIDWSVPNLNINESKSVIEYLISIQTERIEKARKIELIDGGVPDLTLSGEMDRLAALLAQKADLNSSKFKLSMEVEDRGDRKQSGGILAQIFGNKQISAESEEKRETVDIPFVEEKQPVKIRRKGDGDDDN